METKIIYQPEMFGKTKCETKEIIMYTTETVLIAQWLMVAKNDYMVQIFLAGLAEGFPGTTTDFSNSVTAAMDFANEQQKEWLRRAYHDVTNKNLPE